MIHISSGMQGFPTGSRKGSRIAGCDSWRSPSRSWRPSPASSLPSWSSVTGAPTTAPRWRRPHRSRVGGGHAASSRGEADTRPPDIGSRSDPDVPRRRRPTCTAPPSPSSTSRAAAFRRADRLARPATASTASRCTRCSFDHWRRGRDCRAPIVVSFDDGYHSQAVTAAPILSTPPLARSDQPDGAEHRPTSGGYRRARCGG